MYDTAFDPDRLVCPYLRADEPILWIGQPYTSISYRPPLTSVLITLFYLGFSIFWTATALSAGLFAIFGTPFLMIGLYMLYTITSGTKNRLKHTVYAVTPSRALILIQTSRGIQCTEHMLNRMTHVSLDLCRGESGTIRFLPEATGYGYGSHYGYDYDSGYSYRRRRRGVVVEEMGARGQTVSFLMIDNVHHVYRLISDQMAGS